MLSFWLLLIGVLVALFCVAGVAWIVFNAVLNPPRPKLPFPEEYLYPAAKPGPKPPPHLEWVEQQRREAAATRAQAEAEAEARAQAEAEAEAEKWRQWEERQRQEQEARRQAAAERQQWERQQHELIQAEFPAWLIRFAERRGVPYNHANLTALRGWVLLIFDHCDQKHYGRFPIQKLWLEWRDSPLVPGCSLQSLRSHTFFFDLSQTLVDNGLLLPHRGGPKAFKLADDARQRLTPMP